MAGGGGGAHAVIPLGLMLFGAAVLGLLFHKLKQSLIIACIVTGMIAGIWHDEVSVHMPQELTAMLSELGIFFVLFSGGLEVDVAGCIHRWKTVLVQSLGMIGLNMGLMLALAFGVFGQTEPAAALFFALCGTLSSTIVVLGALARRQEMGTVHGQIILGIMVFQDIFAVIGISVLSGLDPSKASGDIGLGIGLIFVKLVALLVILAIIRKTVLEKWFDAMTVSGDHVFLGALGYSLGVSSLCMIASFSGEMGAFFSGVTVASLPYRLEIEQKVEGIKMLGVTLFFIMLGFDLRVTGEEVAIALPLALLLAVIVVFITPLFLLPLGVANGLHAKDSLNIGIIVNQISEFSLIIAKMAYGFDVFDKPTFLIIAFATLLSIFTSSITHLFMDKIVTKGKGFLACMDRRARQEEAHGEHDFKGHVLLLGYGEISHHLLKYYCKRKIDVVVLTLDPMVFKALQALKAKAADTGKLEGDSIQVMVAAPEAGGDDKKPLKAGTQAWSGEDDLEHLHTIYGDYSDPHVWEHFGIKDAFLVVDCQNNGQVEMEVARYCSQLPSTHFVGVVQTYEAVDKLYKHGADYVMQLDHMAGNAIVALLDQEMDKGDQAFVARRAAHQDEQVFLKQTMGDVLFSSGVGDA